ncbi:Planctomycete cytochrome C [Cnuella takakiae]|uniref:Planctomycete cytochrome C n=1 Tax=Cnuella takakiae TaxID=1302690 RepID=A0A1M4XYZ2_9BACT|nr:PSD1 and planctomycete cytochrome C domain-containing protein [Cnuella takakiae]OLY92989.1 hypothetical protein BUE76_14620 [Cnuella takakiae]SHE98556.1 Planctomycete cytochrome C [Cnuella takakiae]
MHYRITTLITLLIIGASIWVACSSGGQGSSDILPDEVSYNFHIRPILSDKCFKCHGPDKNKVEASLQLHDAAHAYAPLTETKGGFAIVPGKPEESELIARISSEDSDYLMPTPEAHLGRLNAYEVALFKKWIKQGARYEPHWAFTPPRKLRLPQIADPKWARNEIDYFIAEGWKRSGLQPNEEAGREQLLKRICLDLTGLPPTLEQQDAYLGEKADGYEQWVDRLLATPQYGEKMAVHWLDIARYADSYGYQDDNIRTQWPWRDWVIHAFNKNLSYDQFLTWQIAGDLLPNATKEQVLATAFFRNHKYTEEGGVVPEEYRIEYILDKTKTFSKGILGLTAECAQCHDHKYDPISQKDYYQLFAFFNTTREQGYEGDVSVSKPAKHPMLEISKSEVQELLRFINFQDTGRLTVSVMGEADTSRKTYILDRGVYDRPTEPVLASAPAAVMPFDTVRLSRNRLGLAQWTVDKQNPLTARVYVNQIWQQLFGQGLVKTSGDFGMQGDLPTHPALLDWLTVDFIEHGWNIKRLVKQIVMSATYRQSAKVRPDHLAKDPENKWLARAPRHRMAAEGVRDLVLASSGLLHRTIGGPSVKPYQPEGLWESATSGRGVLATYQQDTGTALYRRGMYTFIKLTVPPPSAIIFDASNRDQCEVKRSQTNTPLQALVMLNDPLVMEASRVLAQKLSSQQQNPDDWIKIAFRRILCRQPSKRELEMLQQYFKQQQVQFANGKLDVGKTLSVGAYRQIPVSNPAATAALMKVILTLYNLEETLSKT